jgi:hypothetical protein
MAFLYLSRYPALEAFLLLLRERMVRAVSRPTWAEFAASNEDLFAPERKHLEEILPRGDAQVRPGEEHFCLSRQKYRGSDAIAICLWPVTVEVDRIHSR